MDRNIVYEDLRYDKTKHGPGWDERTDKINANAGKIGGAVNKYGVIESSNVESPYYNAPAPLVASISTEQAKTNLQNIESVHEADMNRLSVTEKNKKITEENARKKAEESARRQGGLSAEEIGATGGDVSQYNYIESAGLYLPKNTTTTLQNSVDEIQEELDKVYDQQIALIDSSTAAVLSSIKQTYSDLRAQQNEVNEKSARAMTTFGARGAARYTGESFVSMENAAISAGIKSLSKIASDEFKLIMQAENARADKKYTLFAKKREEIGTLRKEKQKKLDDLQTEIQKKTKEVQEKKIRASRDGAIAGLVSQGITNPEQIIDLLNYDDAGNLIGDFTAEEVAKALKNISPDGDLKNLDAQTRSFFVLKGAGELPGDIAALPEEQQLMAWLNKNKKTTTAPKGRKGTLITKKYADDNKLPYSTIGMTDAEVYQSLYEATPPAWFKEKAQNQMQSSLLPDVLQDLWEQYRKEIINTDEKTGDSGTTTSSGRSI